MGNRPLLLAVIPPPPVITVVDGPLSSEYIEGQQSRVNAIIEAGLARLRQAGVDCRAS